VFRLVDEAVAEIIYEPAEQALAMQIERLGAALGRITARMRFGQCQYGASLCITPLFD
jgi:hypothetical protein